MGKLPLLVGLIVAQSARSGTDHEIGLVTKDGKQRKAFVHLPPGVQGSCSSGGSCPADFEKLPLVFNFHALGANPEKHKDLTGFDTLADKERFVVVCPQGFARGFREPKFVKLSRSPTGYSWNAGGCCPSAIDEKVDDVQFIRELLEYLAVDVARDLGFQIDLTRVYSTGMSNGGFFSHRLGCEMADVFAAIAPVAATLANEPPAGYGDPFKCEPRNAQGEPVAVPVLHIHGTKDSAVPWEGGKTVVTEMPEFGMLVDFSSLFVPALQGLDFPGVQASIDHWLRINNDGALGTKATVSYKSDNVECKYYMGSKQKNVTLCEVFDSGHNWPNSPSKKYCPRPESVTGLLKRTRKRMLQSVKDLMDELGLGCSTSFDATSEIWSFFKRYHL